MSDEPPGFVRRDDSLNRIALQNVSDYNHNCYRCPRWQTCDGVVWGHGNPNASVMVVFAHGFSISPWAAQEKVTANKEWFKEYLIGFGIRSADIFYTHAVKCGTEWVKRRHSLTCVAWLWRDIISVKPNLIIAMGKLATNRVLKGKGYLSRRFGRINTAPHLDALVASYYPAGTLRQRSKNKNFAAEDRRYFEMVAGFARMNPKES